MKQLTIRGFDEQLEKQLRGVAESRQISLNRAAILLMRRGAGLAAPGTTTAGTLQPGTQPPGAQLPGAPEHRVGNALDRFMGVWTAAEAAEFMRSIDWLEQIDPDLWS